MLRLKSISTIVTIDLRSLTLVGCEIKKRIKFTYEHMSWKIHATVQCIPLIVNTVDSEEESFAFFVFFPLTFRFLPNIFVSIIYCKYKSTGTTISFNTCFKD